MDEPKKENTWIKITKGENGFSIENQEGKLLVAEELETDELSAAEKLLWEVINSLGLRGNEFGRDCIAVVRVVGDEYSPGKGEEIVEETYRKVVRKKSKARKKK